jgi:hypothetical protein
MSRRHIPARLFAVCGLGLASTLACGASDSLSSYTSRKSSVKPSPGSPEDFEADDQGYVVPPDRALFSVQIVGRHEDGSQAQAALRSGIDQVRAAAGQGGCLASVEEYTPAHPQGGTVWLGLAELRVEVDLREATDVPARIAALDACVLPLAALMDQEQDGEELTVSLSSPLFGIDDPGSHVGALWARHATQLSRVSVSGGAPQLHPEDLCISDGGVHVLSRRISGVRLGLDLSCRMAGPAADGVVYAGE